MLLGGLINVIRSFPLYNIEIATIRGGTPKTTLVTVKAVQPNSPASSAGIKTGDKILSINNKTITNTGQVTTITHENIGKSLEIVISRNGNSQTIWAIPRSTSTVVQGALGIQVTDSVIAKEPSYQLIPSTILRSYGGYEVATPTLGVFPPAFFNQSREYYDKSLGRLRLLIEGVAAFVIAIGLLKLKKWAYLGFMLVSFVSLIEVVASTFRAGMLGNLFVTTTLLISIAIEALSIWYVYTCRKYFIPHKKTN